jgi:hypothetical protein
LGNLIFIPTEFMKNSICILSFSIIERDSRVLREIQLAQKHFNVDVIGYGNWVPSKGVRFIKLPKQIKGMVFKLRYYSLLILARLVPKCYEFAFWLKPEYKQAVEIIGKENYMLLHANDWDALPVAVEATAQLKTRVLFDAHEFSPEQESDRLLWRIFLKPFKSYLFRKYLIKINKMITVSSGIQDLYIKEFHITPQVILNSPAYQKTLFHPVKNNTINIVHHGHAISGRYLEEMVRMIALTDERYLLNFILVSNSSNKYINRLKKFTQVIAPQKVIFWDPVELSQIVSFINKFDLGLPFLKAPHLNILNALPNKFFDFIMAGLGVVVSPLPAMAQVIETYANGKMSTSQSAEDMASMLNALSVDEINNFKRNSLKLARVFNAEREMGKLLHIYQSLLSDDST